MVKDLRTRGYRCKSKSFPGNPDTERTFKFDCRLWRAARLWSSQMGKNKFFAHTRGNSDPCSRTLGFGFEACGENIAAGASGPRETLEQWKDSDGHCTNMMNPAHNRFAVGYVMTPRSPYTHYWTQSLGNDLEPADESCLPGRAPAPPSTPDVGGGAPGRTGRGSAGEASGRVSGGRPGRGSGRDASARSDGGAGGRDSGPQQGGDSQSRCEDGDGGCAQHYKDFCHLAHVERLCPNTCGKCCRDTSAHCTTHYSNMCNLATVRDVCRGSCGLCG